MLFTLENKLSVCDINNFSVMVHVNVVVEYPDLSTRLFSNHLYTSKKSMTLFKFNINKLTNVLKTPINTQMNLKAGKFPKMIINMIVGKGGKYTIRKTEEMELSGNIGKLKIISSMPIYTSRRSDLMHTSTFIQENLVSYW